MCINIFGIFYLFFVKSTKEKLFSSFCSQFFFNFSNSENNLFSWKLIFGREPKCINIKKLGIYGVCISDKLVENQ